MTTPTTTSPDEAPTRWSRGRVATTIVVVLMVAMWCYVLYLAFGPGRQPPPDRLDDTTFGRRAEAVCATAHDEVAALPPAIEAETPAERADIVEAANERFSLMVDDVAALAPAGEEGTIVALWIDDWRTYLDDRQAYAEALRTDPEARLLVTARDREQITEYIDAFAADNRMPACGTPIDV